VRFAAFQSVVCHRRSGSIGFPAPALSRRFRRKVRVLFFSCRPLHHLRSTGSSSRTLCSSSECYRPSVRPWPESHERLPWGSRSLIATSAHRIQAPGIPSPVALPPSAFLTPPTVSSAVGLVGLFHPTATSRVHSSGVCSSSAAASSFDDRCPLVVVPTPLTDSCPPVSTSPVLALRALLCVRVRDPIFGC